MKNKTMVMLTCIFIGCMISACGNNNEDSYLAETEKENIQIQETENETEEIDTEKIENTEYDSEIEISNEQDVTDDWRSAYKKFIINGAQIDGEYDPNYSISDGSLAKYGLSDVNLDGIPELFLYTGCVDWRYEMYTYYEGEVVYIDGCQTSVSSYVYDMEGYPYYVSIQGSSWGLCISVDSIKDGKTTNILRCETVDYMDYELGEIDNYTVNYYVSGEKTDEATFRENAQSIFPAHICEAITTFSLEAEEPEWTSVIDFSMIEEY